MSARYTLSIIGEIKVDCERFKEASKLVADLDIFFESALAEAIDTFVGSREVGSHIDVKIESAQD